MAGKAAAQATLVALRRQIARIEGRLPDRLEPASEAGRCPDGDGMALSAGPRPDAFLRSGAETFDHALGGGLPAAGLTEFHGAETREAGSVLAFALALAGRAAPPGGSAPVLWVATSEIVREAGRPYPPGLATLFGIAASQFLTADAARLQDVLWIAEEAASIDAFRAVLLEVRGASATLDLTATRRLHRRALMAGRPLFLIREAGLAEPTAAPVRLLVRPAPAGLRSTLGGPLSGSIGPPAFTVTISKSRTAISTTFTLEWTHDAFTDRDAAANPVAVVSPPVIGPRAAPAARQSLAPRSDGGARAPGIQPSGGQHAPRGRS